MGHQGVTLCLAYPGVLLWEPLPGLWMHMGSTQLGRGFSNRTVSWVTVGPADQGICVAGVRGKVTASFSPDDHFTF